MSTYHQDRKLWKDSMAHAEHRFDTWVFGPIYIRIGSRNFTSAESVVAVLAFFDVFCSGIIQQYSGATGDKGRLARYYMLLRAAITDEIITTPKDRRLRECPTCMWPWLWRTSQGFFNHDEADDKQMNIVVEQSLPYDFPFPHAFWSTSSHNWRKWKRRWGDAEMPHLITQSKSANPLCNTEGHFQGWQNDQFRRWDSTAALAPDENTRTVSWAYAARGVRGIYLSRHEYDDNDQAKWKDLVAADGALLPHFTVQDMQRFLPGKWLNDEIIDAYGMLCLRALQPHLLERVRFMPSLFSQGLFTDRMETCQHSFRKRVINPLATERTLDFDDALRKIDKIYFAINQRDTHWILIAMDIATESWNIYDSLSTDAAPGVSDENKGIVDHLASFVADQPGFHKTRRCRSWNIQCVRVTRQPNMCDCGVFMCQFLKHLLQGNEIPQWRDNDIPHLRTVMAWETLEKRVRM